MTTHILEVAERMADRIGVIAHGRLIAEGTLEELRLKAGTATKLILNQITTIAMVRFGKCHENLMVDLRATNEKLRDRAIRIIGTLTGLDCQESAELLEKANGHVKPAIVMHHRSISLEQANELLKKCSGHLRKAIEPPGGSPGCTSGA